MERSSRNSSLQAIENSRRVLLLRTDISQKPVVGYPFLYTWSTVQIKSIVQATPWQETKVFNLSQLFNKVTRPVSSTCLDHFYTTHPGFIADICVPNIGLADHLPVFIRTKYCKKQRDQFYSTIEYRDLMNLNTNELLK